MFAIHLSVDYQYYFPRGNLSSSTTKRGDESLPLMYIALIGKNTFTQSTMLKFKTLSNGTIKFDQQKKFYSARVIDFQ